MSTRTIAISALFAVAVVWPDSALSRESPAPDRANDGPDALIERVVVVVNDRVVLLRELTTTVDRVMKEDPTANRAALERKVLDQLIDHLLIAEEASRRAIRVNDDEIDRAIDEIKKTSAITDAELLSALEFQGFTMAEYRRELRRQILQMKLLTLVVDPQVTDQELRTEYKRQLGDRPDREPFAKVKDRLHRQLYQRKVEERTKQLLAKLRERAYVAVRL